MKKLFYILPILSVMMALTSVLTGCGASKTETELAHIKKVEQAKDYALSSYSVFLNAPNSESAEANYNAMVDQLKQAGLTIDALHIDPSFVAGRLHRLYLQDASNVYDRLRKTHGNIQLAKSLEAKYMFYMNKAHMEISPAMEKQLALNIARNEVEQGHAVQIAHGVNPNPPAKKPAHKKAMASDSSAPRIRPHKPARPS